MPHQKALHPLRVATVGSAELLKQVQILKMAEVTLDLSNLGFVFGFTPQNWNIGLATRRT